MKMIELTKEKFYEFANSNKYNNYCQTENYAEAMKYNNYEHTYIAYTTNDSEILAAGMFLIKKINKSNKIAYSPKGFIIDYEDTELLRKFSRNLIKFFKRKNVILLKINPEIPIATIDYKNNFERKTNNNMNILEEMKKIGYLKRKEIKPLELIEPKLSAILNLKEYEPKNLDDDFKRKILDSANKGYDLEIADSTKIETLKNFINENLFDYYKNIYESFKKDNLADLLLVRINYEKFLLAAKKKVEKEQENNDMLNEKLQQDPSTDNLDKKMKSDKLLEEYKQNVIEASNGLKKNENVFIAGALVIKYKNKISLLIANNNPDYEHISPNYFLYHKIMNMYKEDYEIADLYEIANDFTKDSKYEKMNKFKIGFEPIIYEYIGELDLIINNFKHKLNKKNISFTRILEKK